MPEMRKEGLPSTISLGDVTVSPTPVAAGVQKTYRGDRNDNITVPEGAYYVEVKHVDVTGGVMLVNGEELRYNGSWHADVRTNQTASVQDFVEQVSIQSNGKKYYLRVAYPSSNPINLSIFD